MLSGLVRPAGDASSTGGRPPARVAFNPDARIILAVHVGSTRVLVAVTDLKGKVLSERSLPLKAADGPAAVLGQAVEQVPELLATASRRLSELAGVGIALPGPVERGTGRPLKANILPGWEGFDIAGYLQQYLPVPVLVDNDVNMMALAERNRHWTEHENFFFLNIAEDIRSAVISGGQLQHGANGMAGDLGHVQVAPTSDVLCTCGNYGCLQALSSGPGIVRRLRNEGLDASGAADLLDLAVAGNPQTLQAIRQAGRDIGGVLATAVNLLNPSAIVVGGSIGELGEQLVAGIREVIYQRCPPLATSQLRIGTAIAGAHAAVYGASQMVAQHVLSPDAVEATLAANTTRGR
ncbi:ROK family protein [Pseudarthrobacter sp. BRE9]|uniref:ROK family protein n=1 Tax=Pseudarthrobacter sp. BRE9 TaxID=2962582 RepID=UPI00288C3767|nr:ROK family protein [Pseudarthrobacter sp. BRE9]